MCYKTTIYCLLLIGLPVLSCAQETYFTQTHTVPLQINPAQVAVDNKAALMLDYRQQQFLEDVSLQTTVFTGKFPLISKETNRRWGGVGITLLNDRSSDHQLFQRTQFEAAFAYNFTLAPHTYLSWGTQGGYHQRRFSAEGITTGSQYVQNVGFNPETSIGESIDGMRSSYWNLGSGLQYYRTDPRHEIITSLGVVVHRLHQPRESFLSNNYRLARQYVVQGEHRVFDNRTWTIAPQVLWMHQGQQNLLRIGTRYTYHFTNDNPLDPLQSGSIDFGTYYSDAKAIALSIRFNQPSFSAGLSYDIGLTGHALQNATELSLTIRKSINRRKPAKVIRDYSVGDVRKFYEKKANIKPAQTTDSLANSKEKIASEKALAAGQKDDANQTPVMFNLKKTFSFAFNDASLTPEAQAYFDDFVKLMQINPSLQLRVVGHTDNVGKERVNLKVSLARAQAVKDYLVAQGISKSRITVEGAGAAEPLLPNDTEANRATNRRVELIVSQQTQR